jgi:hypothetical protein
MLILQKRCSLMKLLEQLQLQVPYQKLPLQLEQHRGY